MGQVISKDGTIITYSVCGKEAGNSKPGLVLVHGAGASSNRWTSVLPLFEPHYQVFTLNRRGRKHSVEKRPYSINAEFEDVAALVNQIYHQGVQSIYVLGHSFGAICCLEACLLTPYINKLVLYEPPVCGLGVEVYPLGFLERIEHYRKTENREALVSAFLEDVIHYSPEELRLFQSSELWSDELEIAHILPRELRAAVYYQFDERRFMAMNTETLLLCGSNSQPFFKVAADMIESGLTSSCQKLLPGQQHIAMDTAPEMFCRTVIDFLC